MPSQLKRAKSINKKWAREITEWEKINGRDFSWRLNRTPYRILIAEVLLKRTTSTAALRVYEDFLKKYPDILVLKNASYRELENILRPIGLYRQRAKQLKDIAEYTVNNLDGELLPNEKILLEIPGVGAYTSSAILCFAYDVPKAVIDSNVERILKRAFETEGKELKAIAETLINNLEPHTYNYGMLDLGATICHYRYPKCPECPLKNYCCFFRKIKI